MPIATREFQYGILDVTFKLINEDQLPEDHQITQIKVGGAVSYKPDVSTVDVTNIDQRPLLLDSNYQCLINQSTLQCDSKYWPVQIDIPVFTVFSGLFYSITPPTNDDMLRISFDSAGSAATEFDKQHHGLTSFYEAYLNGASLNDLNTSAVYYNERDIAGLDERLTEISGTYQTNYNLYIEYLAKFKNYWEKDSWVGRAYAELREIGLLNGQDADQYIWEQQNYSASCTKQCTTTTKEALDYLQIKYYLDNGVKKYSREDCIQHTAAIAAKLTEYWNIAYMAATTIGLFLPETWDCLTQLEAGNLPDIYLSQLPLIVNNGYHQEHWDQVGAPAINFNIVPAIQAQGSRLHRQFKFYNINRQYEQPLMMKSETTTGALHYTNTNNYYEPLPLRDATTAAPADEHYWQFAHQQHHGNLDSTSAYYTTTSYRETNYIASSLNGRRTPASILADWLGSAKLADITTNIDWLDIHYNPNISFLTWLAQSREYNDAKYYTLREEHDKLWHHLHEAYPGVFRESNYVNQDASTALELYNASKRELEASCQPQFSYSLTGMDIYMHDSDYNPMRLQVTDQIRIDYQEDIHGADTLGKALREPLYITGIRHNLRNDGDYQFDVTTRKGTDVMMQRFAQLLNFGN